MAKIFGLTSNIDPGIFKKNKKKDNRVALAPEETEEFRIRGQSVLRSLLRESNSKEVDDEEEISSLESGHKTKGTNEPNSHHKVSRLKRFKMAMERRRLDNTGSFAANTKVYGPSDKKPIKTALPSNSTHFTSGRPQSKGHDFSAIKANGCDARSRSSCSSTRSTGSLQVIEEDTEYL
mmetsp:Transcript_16272/g.30201  ORF Transcript_16272/g.30201 Transcript_16272/m.30201 type:complete len:178 (+) Transcript_16272:442-975(+)